MLSRGRQPELDSQKLLLLLTVAVVEGLLWVALRQCNFTLALYSSMVASTAQRFWPVSIESPVGNNLGWLESNSCVLMRRSIQGSSTRFWWDRQTARHNSVL